MKIKFLTLLAVVSIALVSCKKEAKTEETVAITQELFKVSLDALIHKNDTLHLYYGQDMNEDFTEENSIWLPVAGMETSQKITFNLPEDVLPVKIRLDFGVNRDNKEIVLNTVAFDYYSKSFVMRDSAIFNYFRPDESATIIDYDKRILKRKDPNSIKGASLYPHDVAFKAEMEKLIK